MTHGTEGVPRELFDRLIAGWSSSRVCNAEFIYRGHNEHTGQR